MGIVLLILKILGITILSILGLILLLLLLILFVPIRYRASGIVDSADGYFKDVNVRVHWLFRCISLKIETDEDRNVWKKLRFLWFFGKKGDSVVYPKEAAETEDDHKPENEAPESAAETEGDKPETSETEGDKPETAETESVKPDSAETEGAKHETSEAEGDKPDTAETAEDRPDTAEQAAEEPQPKKKKSFGDRIEDAQETLESVLELFSKRKDLLKRYLTKKSTKEAVGKLWKYTKWLLKHLAPRKGHAEVTFGMDDPDKTGLLFGIAANLYPWYGDHVVVIPEFERKMLLAEGDIRGRIRLWGVAIRAFSIWRDKNIRKVRKEFEKVKETMTGTPADVKKLLHHEDEAA
ncbi:MAG: hypothetical protein IKX54_05730 [Lachnospiraceae bacterium]|nr:hypothetical protein [Lachnospiraceae bacterium]